MRKKVEIRAFIAKEVQQLNQLFIKGGKLAGKPVVQFTANDYKYLDGSLERFGRFELPFYLAHSIHQELGNRLKMPIPGAIWYWIKESDGSVTKDYLPTQVTLLHDTLGAYLLLLREERFLQALILFRSYIEYSSQFYASLLDYDFFLKYTSNAMMEEDYKKLWFSALKPSKVLDKIKKMHEEINSLLKEKKIDFGENAIYRREFFPFDSKLRGYLYSELSALAHGSHKSLTQNDEVKLYAKVWFCTSYMVESYAVIDELMSIYFAYKPVELFNKWITVEVYKKSMQPGVQIYLAEEDSNRN